MKKLIRIGARKSKLSLIQTEKIKIQLEKENPHYEFKIIPIHDANHLEKKSDVSLKDKFTKPIERALLKEKIDIAVHSLKDLESKKKKKLKIIFISPREDARDVFISNKYQDLNSVPADEKIATSSLRRSMQVKYHYPHLQIIPIRGNIDRRIEILNHSSSDIAGLIIAYAAIKRLNCDNSIIFKSILNLKKFVPSPGQGALAIQCLRKKALHFRNLFKKHNFIHKKDLSIYIERKILSIIDASCDFPIGIFSKKIHKLRYKIYLDFYPLNTHQRIFLTKKAIISSKKEADLFINAIINEWREKSAKLTF